MAAQWCIGLMTGTVMDGNVDIAMLKTDGQTIEEFGPYTLASYPPETNQLIAEAMAAAQDWNFASEEPEISHERRKHSARDKPTQFHISFQKTPFQRKILR